jgi:hypothetical protein
MHRYTNIFFSLLLAVLAVSCSRRTTPDAVQEKVARRKTPELVAAMDSLSQLRPKYFYTKIKCDYSDTNQNLNFRTSIRMVKDSVVNALITYASIPIVNSLIRPDSVIISNRREKCVIRQNMSYIKDQFGVSFDYRNIEEIFLGLPVGFDTTQKYFQIHDPFNYILSSHKKREIKRENRNKPDRDKPDRDKPDRDRNNDMLDRLRKDDRNDEDDDEVILKYYLSNDIRSLKRIFIDSPNDSTTIDIQYLSRDSVGAYMIPNEVQIEIVTPRNKVVMSMDYDKSEVDVPQQIHFVIPEEYGVCEEK